MRQWRANLNVWDWLYFVFLLSGVWKVYIQFYNLPVPDITLVTGGGVAAYCVAKIVSGRPFYLRELRVPTLLLAVLLAWAIFTFSYTVSPGYFLMKTLGFMVCILALMYPAMANADPRKLLLGFAITLLFTLLVFLLIYPSLLAARSRLDDNLAGVYLQAGYLAGLGLLFLCFYVKDISAVWRWPLGVICLGSLLLSGARGPLIFAVGAAAFSLIGSKSKKARITGFILASLAVVMSIALFLSSDYLPSGLQAVLDRSMARFYSLVGDQDISSLSERARAAEFSLQLIFRDAAQFLFGSGFGSYGILYFGQDIRAHPHNAFLEIAVELGAVGIFIYFGYIASLGVRLLKNRDLSGILIFGYLILNSMKSSSFVESRVMFGATGLLMVLSLMSRKNLKMQRALRASFQSSEERATVEGTASASR